jgi:hypothetical protein
LILFDGEIETTGQRDKTPTELWKTFKPVLEQPGLVDDEADEPQAQSAAEKKTETNRKTEGLFNRTHLEQTTQATRNEL